MDVRLTVVEGAKPATVRLRLPTVMGRSSAANLKVPHAQVSRRHCELYEEDGLLVVYDLGSSNGTYVDRLRIDEPTFIYPGGSLRVGQVVFRADYASPAACDAGQQTSSPTRESEGERPPVEVDVEVDVEGEPPTANSPREGSRGCCPPAMPGPSGDALSAPHVSEISAVVSYQETAEGSFLGIDALSSREHASSGQQEPLAPEGGLAEKGQEFVLETGSSAPRPIDKGDSALRRFLDRF